MTGLRRPAAAATASPPSPAADTLMIVKSPTCASSRAAVSQGTRSAASLSALLRVSSCVGCGSGGVSVSTAGASTRGSTTGSTSCSTLYSTTGEGGSTRALWKTGSNGGATLVSVTGSGDASSMAGGAGSGIRSNAGWASAAIGGAAGVTAGAETGVSAMAGSGGTSTPRGLNGAGKPSMPGTSTGPRPIDAANSSGGSCRTISSSGRSSRPFTIRSPTSPGATANTVGGNCSATTSHATCTTP